MTKNICLLLVPFALYAQTTINGELIFTGSSDASRANRTLPYRTGTGSPAGRDTCLKVGETYFQSDAASSQNIWACTAPGTPGTWSQIGTSVLTGTSGPSGLCTAGALYSRTDMRQFYVCSGRNVWQPANYLVDFAANQPTNCVAGQLFLATDTGMLAFCSISGSPGTWQPITAPVSTVFGRAGAVAAQSGDYSAEQVTNAVDTTKAYSDPAWINSLAWSKLSSVPSIEVTTNKNSADGYAGLDSSAKILSSELPAPAPGALGGVKSADCSSGGQFGVQNCIPCHASRYSSQTAYAGDRSTSIYTAWGAVMSPFPGSRVTLKSQ